MRPPKAKKVAKASATSKASTRKLGPKFCYQITDSNEARWQFFEIDPSDMEKVDPNAYAVTIPSKNMVVVERGLADDVRDIALFHEILHTCFSAPGDPEVLRRILGCEADKVDDMEEGFVSFVAPRLYALLVKNGMLKMPVVPR